MVEDDWGLDDGRAKVASAYEFAGCYGADYLGERGGAEGFLVVAERGCGETKEVAGVEPCYGVHPAGCGGVVGFVDDEEMYPWDVRYFEV